MFKKRGKKPWRRYWKWKNGKLVEIKKGCAKQKPKPKNPKPKATKPLKVSRQQRTDNYQKYLDTEHWKQRRKAALKHAHFHCEECGRKKTLQVHHLHYHSLFAEKTEDLRVLCRDCHENAHDIDREAREHLRAIMREELV